MVSVRTIDEFTTGRRLEGPTVELPSFEVSVRELIESRVRQEVDRYNREKPGTYYGLIQPTDTEVLLNGPVTRRFKPVDPERQVEIALEAFRKQQILVLLPGGQAESVDQIVRLNENDEVSFLRLVPLVGG
ncbi:MAG: hypothetical protein AKCLJLPJ_01947 [Fimbriimonadales bacterium]|nr:MAG: hypothetical protein EDM73_09795 [Armatimonadota bacterium]MBV6503853.1 hypothetical protein [Fimbriimonadales bacterium]MCE7899606.1 hypothetical protein [Armatimonadetes bacterium ATM1]MDL1927691.1 hypothetical protein [Fimbriimonadia bacterium ATM]MBC6970661.1 hypothetical protein [Armatimonadota bacterium]